VNATGQSYNVACAESVSLNQLFHLMRDKLALEEPRFSVATPQYDPFRPGDIRFSGASIEKARRMLSFSPTHTVDQGLTEALEWYVDKARTSSARTTMGVARHTTLPVNLPAHGGAPLTVATP
jgi:UDP-N-acetylglucosamine 4-epimerase